MNPTDPFTYVWLLPAGAAFCWVFAIGNTFATQATRSQALSRPVTLIHSHIDFGEIHRIYPADVGLVGDARLVLQDLIAAIQDRLSGSKRERPDVIANVREQKERWWSAWHSRLTSEEVPLNPFRVTWDFMHTVPREETILLHDAGAVRGHSCHHYEAIIPGGFMGMGNQSEMGWTMGAAMGVKRAHPDKLVAYILGDGSFGMTGLDLETAVRHQLPTLGLVYNNRSMGIVMDIQKRDFEERYTMVELGGDYVQIARALGAWAERVETPGEIKPVLERAIRATREGQPALVEFITKQLEPQPRPDQEPGTF